jgi:hypothetical protein
MTNLDADIAHRIKTKGKPEQAQKTEPHRRDRRAARGAKVARQRARDSELHSIPPA